MELMDDVEMSDLLFFGVALHRELSSSLSEASSMKGDVVSLLGGWWDVL